MVVRLTGERTELDSTTAAVRCPRLHARTSPARRKSSGGRRPRLRSAGRRVRRAKKKKLKSKRKRVVHGPDDDCLSRFFPLTSLITRVQTVLWVYCFWPLKAGGPHSQHRNVRDLETLRRRPSATVRERWWRRGRRRSSGPSAPREDNFGGARASPRYEAATPATISYLRRRSPRIRHVGFYCYSLFFFFTILSFFFLLISFPIHFRPVCPRLFVFNRSPRTYHYGCLQNFSTTSRGVLGPNPSGTTIIAIVATSAPFIFRTEFYHNLLARPLR